MTKQMFNRPRAVAKISFGILLTAFTALLATGSFANADTASISNTGYGSNNSISIVNTSNTSVSSTNSTSVSNSTTQSSTSGSANVSGNTVGGSATSGSTSNTSSTSTSVTQTSQP